MNNIVKLLLSINFIISFNLIAQLSFFTSEACSSLCFVINQTDRNDLVGNSNLKFPYATENENERDEKKDKESKDSLAELDVLIPRTYQFSLLAQLNIFNDSDELFFPDPHLEPINPPPDFPEKIRS